MKTTNAAIIGLSIILGLGLLGHLHGAVEEANPTVAAPVGRYQVVYGQIPKTGVRDEPMFCLVDTVTGKTWFRDNAVGKWYETTTGGPAAK
jgi:hypothetical protein